MTAWSWLSFITGAVSVIVAELLIGAIVIAWIVVALARRGQHLKKQTDVASVLGQVKKGFGPPAPPPAA